jgi:ABC-type multidrug transport system fused ATPase/permease subunit
MSFKLKAAASSFFTYRQFLKPFEFRPIFFLGAVFLSLSAAFFEGITAALLIPFAKGCIERNFSFADKIPVLGEFLNFFPEFISKSVSGIFIFLLFLMFSAAVLKNLFSYLSSITLNYQIRKITNAMRQVVFKRYLSFGKLYFDRSSIGYLSEVLMGFTQQIGGQLKTVHQVLTMNFMLIVYFAIMFAISWKLTLLVLLTFPLLHYSLNWLIKQIRRTSHYFAECRVALSKKIFNALSCILFIKACANEEEEKSRFSETSGLVAKMEYSMDKKWSLSAPIQEIVLLFMLIILAGAMAYLVAVDKSVNIPALVAYVYALKKSGGAFTVLNYVKISFAQISGAINGIKQVLSDDEKYFEVEGNKEFEGLKENILFNHLNFSFPASNFSLSDISFSIGKGKMVALVGASGAGKTTIINLILRFYNSQPNTLLVDGEDINNFTLRSYRSHTAFVSQETALFNDTLRQNILYGLSRKVSEEELMETLKSARLYDFVMTLPEKLETLIGDRGVKLSGGERQRVAIARAMLRKAEILILDEATSSLDSRTEKLIQESIETVIKNRTAIVIAHRLSTIRNADKIVVIENGKVVEEGNLQELLDKKGKFYEFWEEQKFY